MCSFLSCPDDITLLSYLVGASFLIALIVFLRSKNKLLAILTFSLLTNSACILTTLSGSLIFRIYGFGWVPFFSVFVWPIINIMFIVYNVRKKKQ